MEKGSFCFCGEVKYPRAKSCWACHVKNKKAKKDLVIKEQGEYRKRTVVKERRNRLSKEWNKTNISSVLCTHAKRRAKDCAVPFALKKEDIIVPECCPVLGFKLDINNKRLLDNSPTLDRVIPELGYVKGNVQVISFRANRIKNNATLEELEKVTDYVRRNSF